MLHYIRLGTVGQVEYSPDLVNNAHPRVMCKVRGTQAKCIQLILYLKVTTLYISTRSCDISHGPYLTLVPNFLMPCDNLHTYLPKVYLATLRTTTPLH